MSKPVPWVAVPSYVTVAWDVYDAWRSSIAWRDLRRCYSRWSREEIERNTAAFNEAAVSIKPLITSKAAQRAKAALGEEWVLVLCRQVFIDVPKSDPFEKNFVDRVARFREILEERYG